MSARPKLFWAYELRGFSSTAFSNEPIASLRLPIWSCTRPSVFHAPDRFGRVEHGDLRELEGALGVTPDELLPRACERALGPGIVVGLDAGLSAAHLRFDVWLRRIGRDDGADLLRGRGRRDVLARGDGGGQGDCDQDSLDAG